MLMATLGMTMPAPPKTTMNIVVPLATLLALRAGIMPGTGAHAPPEPCPTCGASTIDGPAAESDVPADQSTDETGPESDSTPQIPEVHAWAEGLGLIGHSILQRLLSGEPDLRRIVTDNLTGVPINYGPLVHNPPRSMRRRVQLRDRICRFPGCNRHATRPGHADADLDHINPHHPDGSGGDTSDWNLIALCREHHRMKHHTAWTPTLRQDGTVIWHNTQLGWTIIDRPQK